MSKYEIVKFVNDEIKLDVNVSPKEETVWLSLDQMSKLFDRHRSVLSRHVDNIFKEKELNKYSSVHFLHIAGSTKPVKFYNLDVVISVGYRIKSKRGVIFRKWASNVLKQYLLKGYAISNRSIITKENYLGAKTFLINKVNDEKWVKSFIKKDKNMKINSMLVVIKLQLS